MLTNSGVRLHVGHQHSCFLPILTRFVDYYSPFWGLDAISMVVEPKVRLRVGHQQSPSWLILTRFSDYDLVWGSWNDFHDWRTPRCIYVSVISTRSFG